MNLLEQIVAATRKRVERDKKAGLPRQSAKPQPPFLFEQNLRRPGMAFICEIKKASPSAGVLAKDFPYLHIAREYESAGADAISVLTEPDYFQGCDRHLAEIREVVSVPLLRKDFIIDPFQIEQSARLGANAILLLCAILAPAQLAAYIAAAHRLGLSCLVEAHDERELSMALGAGARVVGVNNRCLKTFRVDMGNSIRLRKLVPKNVVFVSESGVDTAGDVQRLRGHGMDAVLVGGALMRSPNRRAALAALRGSET